MPQISWGGLHASAAFLCPILPFQAGFNSDFAFDFVRRASARSDDGSHAGDGAPLQRSMSLGSNAGFNADSQYEYRPQPLAATQGLR